MFRLIQCVCLLWMACVSNPSTTRAADSDTAGSSIKILLVTGGCCHDYDFQTKAMQLAFAKHGAEAVWTVVNEGGNGTDAQIDLYKNPNWAAGFDVVIHNECFAATKDPDYVRSITGSHRAGR